MAKVTLLFLLSISNVYGTIYQVGTGYTYIKISDITLSNLQPGDTVKIHGQVAHYKEILIINSQGTANQPIVFQGVKGINGEPAVIDGNGATTHSQFSWANSTYVQGLGLVIPYHASYLVFDNLTFTNADAAYSFTKTSGPSQNWADFSTGLYILGPSDHIKVRHCTIKFNGVGFFVNSNNYISNDILVEYCSVFANGVVGSYLEHNIYSEGINVTYQYNYIGPTRNGSAGSQVKTRDVGFIFRYNYVDKGNTKVPDDNGMLVTYTGNGARKIDMVNIQASALEDQYTVAGYNNSFVYGNVFLNDDRQSSFDFHYGGEGDACNGCSWRKGTLYFYNNTFVNIMDQSDIYKAAIFDVTGTATVEAFNNIFYSKSKTSGSAPTSLGFMRDEGNLHLGINYSSQDISDWMQTGAATGTVTGGFDGNSTTMITSSTNNAGFVNLSNDDVRLGSNSICAFAGGTLKAATLPDNNVTSQYIKHLKDSTRTNVFALGAFTLYCTTCQMISGLPLTLSSTYGSSPISLANVIATSGLSIIFISSNIAVATVNGDNIVIVGVGTATITGIQNGNGTYNGVTVTSTLTVGKGSQTISFSSIFNQTLTGSSIVLTISGSTTSNLSVNYTLSSIPADIAILNGNILTINKPGSITITASQNGNGNYNIASSINSAFQVFTIIGNATTTIYLENPAETIKVYPNPSNGKFTIETLQSAGIEVVNAIGSIVLKDHIEGGTNSFKKEILINGKGLFLINITHGHKTEIRKVLVE